MTRTQEQLEAWINQLIREDKLYKFYNLNSAKNYNEPVFTRV